MIVFAIAFQSLAIAAHIPTAEIGSNYFQETHPEHLFRDCTTFCERITGSEQLPHVLEIALQTAISLSTVSMIIVSGDVAMSRSAPRVKQRPPVRISRSSHLSLRQRLGPSGKDS